MDVKNGNTNGAPAPENNGHGTADDTDKTCSNTEANNNATAYAAMNTTAPDTHRFQTHFKLKLPLTVFSEVPVPEPMDLKIVYADGTTDDTCKNSKAQNNATINSTAPETHFKLKRLDQLIQNVKENLDNYDVNKEILLAEVSEIEPEDLEDFRSKEILILGNQIYFLGHTNVHTEGVRILTNMLEGLMDKDKMGEYAVRNGVPCVYVNVLRCGTISQALPDCSINRNLPHEYSTNIPIVAEVGVTHYTLYLFLVQLMQYLSKYTRTTYAIGMKFIANPTNIEDFNVHFVVLKRTLPIDINESNELLKIWDKPSKTCNCKKVKEPDVTFDKSFFALYGVELYYYRHINNQNIAEDFETPPFPENDMPIRKIAIKGEEMMVLKEFYENWHRRRFSSTQAPAEPPAEAQAEGLAENDN